MKLEKYQMEKHRLRERVMELAEQNVSLQREVAMFGERDESSDTPPDRSFEKMSVERAPYHSYRDSISGQVEPASGARASILGQDYLPKGTVGQARAAGAPVLTDTSDGASSYGKKPRKQKENV